MKAVRRTAKKSGAMNGNANGHNGRGSVTQKIDVVNYGKPLNSITAQDMNLEGARLFSRLLNVRPPRFRQVGAGFSNLGPPIEG